MKLKVKLLGLKTAMVCFLVSFIITMPSPALSEILVTDITLVDVNTKSFSLICNISEPSRGNLRVFDLNGTLLSVEVENESAHQPSTIDPTSGFTDAELNLIQKFTVKGLEPNNTYYYQLIFGEREYPLDNPSSHGNDYKVVTEKERGIAEPGSNDIVINNILLFPMLREDGQTPASGTLLVLTEIQDTQGHILNDYPLSSWVGGCCENKPQYGCINLNNLFNESSKLPCELLGQEVFKVKYWSGIQNIQGGQNKIYSSVLPAEVQVAGKTIPQAKIANLYYHDADHDGWGDSGSDMHISFESTPTVGYAKANGDCDDSNDTIHPEANELCDLKDNDCDESTDEDFEVGQSCESGVGECKRTGFLVCTADSTNVICNAEAAEPTDELCDGRDNNCNGLIDEEDAQGCQIYYKDADGDGYGEDKNDHRCLCEADMEQKYTATILKALAGDVNGDGKLSPNDAVVILRCILHISQCPPLSSADVTGDGRLTPADATCILRKILHLNSCLGPAD